MTAGDVVKKFYDDLQILSRLKNRKINNLMEAVTKVLFNEKIFDGVFRYQILKRCQEHYRAHIFAPEKLLQLMDQNGGTISMSGIALLRTLETNGIKYSRDSILPSTAAIRRRAEVVDAVARKLVPFKEGVLANGAEYCEFEVAPVVNMMIKGYGLEEASKNRSIRINQALDGARITNRLHHTTYGLKMVDIGARDPVTKNLIYGSTDSTTLQSKHYCHPLKIILSQESNEVVDEFKEVIKQVKSLSNEDGSINLLNGAKPIKTYVNADLSAQWKLLKQGYGVKRGDGNPCHMCARKDRHIHEPNAVQCSRWCELHKDEDPDWQCFHQDFLSEDKVNEMREELKEVQKELQSVLSNFEEIQQDSTIKINEDPRKPVSEFQLEDQSSIHFDTENSDISTDTLLAYEDLIHYNLKIRGMSMNGNLRDCQRRLQMQMIQEHNYIRLNDSINHADGIDKNFILLEDCTPCILHMEMRTTLKFLQMILTDGLDTVKDEKNVKQKFKEYIKNINLIFNEQIFGNAIRPYNFSVPHDENKKIIDDITLDGDRCRTLSYNFQPILDLCFSDNYVKSEWQIILYNYIQAFEILRQKEDLSIKEIKKFQYHVDIFFQHYMSLVGRPGITNYFHMLGSGHIADYLYQCGNLYVHSQQGWEAFNSFLKVYYFRRTNRGGGKGADFNRIRQLSRWLGRRLLWNSGMEYTSMVTIAKDDSTDNKAHDCTNVDADEEDEEYLISQYTTVHDDDITLNEYCNDYTNFFNTEDHRDEGHESTTTSECTNEKIHNTDEGHESTTTSECTNEKIHNTDEKGDTNDSCQTEHLTGNNVDMSFDSSKSGGTSTEGENDLSFDYFPIFSENSEDSEDK